MNKLLILIKTYLLMFWGSLKYGRLAKRNSRIFGSGAAIAAVFLFVAVMMGYSAAAQLTAYANAGVSELVLYNSLLTGLVVSILIALMRSRGAESGKDADLLLALPLPRGIILLAKGGARYLFDLAPLLMLVLPSIVVYFVQLDPGLPFLLRGLLVLLLLPLLSSGIASCVNWFLFKIGNRVKNPQLIITVLSMLLLLGFIVGDFLFGAGMNEADSAAQLVHAYQSVAPLDWAAGFITSGDGLHLIKFFALTGLPFGLGLWLSSRIFGARRRTWHSTSRELVFRRRSRVGALLAKELQHYFNSTIYLLNTGFGLVMALLFTAVLLFAGHQIFDQLLAAGGGDFTSLLPLILIMLYSFCAGTCYTAACSISLEGKQLDILKAQPLPINEIFAAKWLTNIIITLPLTFICSLVAALYLRLSFSEVIFVVLIPSLLCILSATFGLAINLALPRLDWQDETQVVKQSMAAMLALVVAIFPVGLPSAVWLIWGQGRISFVVYGLATATLLLVLSAAACLWLQRRGKALFAALS
jgi:ABC-2 type transport system permease protein